MGHLGENNEKSETEGWLWKHLLSYTNILFLPAPHFINSLSCSKIDLLLLWLGKTPPKSVICWNRPFIFYLFLIIWKINYLENCFNQYHFHLLWMIIWSRHPPPFCPLIGCMGIWSLWMSVAWVSGQNETISLWMPFRVLKQKVVIYTWKPSAYRQEQLLN